YSESFEQSLIDQTLDLVKISNISVVQPATYPIKPARPRILLNLMLGILLGIFGGLGLAFISESVDHSFGKPEDIERTLEISALGAIASLYPEGASPQEKASMALPARFDPSLPFMKDFEAVAERLLMGSKAQAEPQRIFSITSCRKGAGVSTVAAYLASSLARHSDGRVLLVDVNFQDPFVHQIFDISLSPGLADLSGGAYSQTSVIQPSPVNKLDVLCAGKTSMASDKRIFESKGFADLLKYWKHEYSFVLIDTPAVWEENYVVTLANMVDGVIMVFEAEEDRWEVAQRAKDRLAVGGATLVGGILNKRLFYVPKWLYQRL
ncbi:MAG TPA: CpsD/CapB family tyrosine-protein kinase, partial [Thermodesulfobacteriota bacterium]|nr:CpsD/CapB family tyrosine-protein kinase [Thermodesulfobacteriota bacterium]